MNIIKIWLVSFSNGEEWHICGELFDFLFELCSYAKENGLEEPVIKYLRWVPCVSKATSFVEGQV